MTLFRVLTLILANWRAGLMWWAPSRRYAHHIASRQQAAALLDVDAHAPPKEIRAA